MSETSSATHEDLSPQDVKEWLVKKIAFKLEIAEKEVDVHQFFDDFALDSTEALVLSGELENWLGFELETTALWYHPTISELSEYIAQKQAEHAGN